jgi:putative oxygen-independent coproporphyrinogen III oxidase
MRTFLLHFLSVWLHSFSKLRVNAWTVSIKQYQTKTRWTSRHQCHCFNIDYEKDPKMVSSYNSLTPTPLGVYIHIPYCQRRCRYCDFAILPIGSINQQSKQTTIPMDGFLSMDLRYRQAIVDEIRWTFQNQSPNRPISSIYLGGGTPSLAPLDTIRTILQEIRRHTVAVHDIEITMEMDPGTIDEQKLRDLAALGINRISLGVQSLKDSVLEYIGRVHRLVDIENAMDCIQKVYGCYNVTSTHDKATNHTGSPPNLSIDLISGLPGISLADWADILETTVHQFKPDHISIYDLQIEKNTVFGKWYSQDDEDVTTIPYNTLGKDGSLSNGSYRNTPNFSLPSPEDCAYMYRYASGYLRKEGYEHYEISSYARPGKRSRHNQVYWGYDTEWYAFGLGSTSFWNHTRIARPRAMADYLAWLHQHKVQSIDSQNDTTNIRDWQIYTPERLTDILLTRLRTADGLDLEWVRQKYGDDTVERILRGVQLAMELNLATIELQQETKVLLRLQDSMGFLFSNTILSNIFVELSEDSYHQLDDHRGEGGETRSIPV